MTDASKDTFRVKLTGTGLSVDQEIPRDVALRIVNLVVGGVSLGGSELGQPVLQSNAGTGSTSVGASDPLPSNATPKQFVTSKKPATDVERIACLAYYLRHHRSVTQFKTSDLTKLNTDAQQLDFSNASYSAENATKSGLLGKAGKGTKQITAKGEAVVEALPDREKVKDAMKDGGKRRRRTRKAKA